MTISIFDANDNVVDELYVSDMTLAEARIYAEECIKEGWSYLIS